jgi:hypothetical protein
MSAPETLLPAINQILTRSCGTKNFATFTPPPLVLVQALDARRIAVNQERIKEGKLPYNTMYDLSGNVINIEELK